jgi:stearoyl-CoA desaturase (delta-9 desaturase)
MSGPFIALSEEPSETSPQAVPATVYLVNVLVVTVPFVALVVGMALLWNAGFGWLYFGLLLGLYAMTGLGITIGYHRLFTHRSFQCGPVLRLLIGIAGSMAAEGPLLKWVATHRRHHQHSDDESDPHSPHQHGHGIRGLIAGAWHAHIGWIFAPDPPDLNRYVVDLQADPIVRFVDRFFILWMLLGLLIPAVLGGLISGSWTGAWLGLLWGGLVRICLLHHVSWSINSVCHLWGSRPFRSHDHSRNNILFGILGLGEGWHNNHHAFPTSARHGLRWWQFDMSYVLIRAMAMVKLVWNVRRPSEAAMAAKLAR